MGQQAEARGQLEVSAPALPKDSAGKKTVKVTELRCVSENKTQNSVIKIGETAS